MQNKENKFQSPVVTPWDVVEKFYPEYYSSEEIALSNDFEVVVNKRKNDDEPDEGSGAEHLFNELQYNFLNSERSYFDDFLELERAKTLIAVYEKTMLKMDELLKSKIN